MFKRSSLCFLLQLVHWEGEKEERHIHWYKGSITNHASSLTKYSTKNRQLEQAKKTEPCDIL